MVGVNAGVRACDVRQADEELAYEVGPVHDYFWHRRHRAGRSAQLVDIAILAILTAMVGLVLILHH
jgi:hypothetical protein